MAPKSTRRFASQCSASCSKHVSNVLGIHAGELNFFPRPGFQIHRFLEFVHMEMQDEPHRSRRHGRSPLGYLFVPSPPAGGAVRTLRRVHPTGWGTGGLKTRPGRRVRIDIIYVALWTTCRPRPRQICLLFSFFPSARSQGVGTETENHRSRRVTRIEFVRNRLATGPKLVVCGPGVSCSRVHCRAWRRAKRPESSFAFRFCGC